jgi:hypothetical protein
MTLGLRETRPDELDEINAFRAGFRFGVDHGIAFRRGSWNCFPKGSRGYLEGYEPKHAYFFLRIGLFLQWRGRWKKK